MLIAGTAVEHQGIRSWRVGEIGRLGGSWRHPKGALDECPHPIWLTWASAVDAPTRGLGGATATNLGHHGGLAQFNLTAAISS